MEKSLNKKRETLSFAQEANEDIELLLNSIKCNEFSEKQIKKILNIKKEFYYGFIKQLYFADIWDWEDLVDKIDDLIKKSNVLSS